MPAELAISFGTMPLFIMFTWFVIQTGYRWGDMQQTVQTKAKTYKSYSTYDVTIIKSRRKIKIYFNRQINRGEFNF